MGQELTEETIYFAIAIAGIAFVLVILFLGYLLVVIVSARRIRQAGHMASTVIALNKEMLLILFDKKGRLIRMESNHGLFRDYEAEKFVGKSAMGLPFLPANLFADNESDTGASRMISNLANRKVTPVKKNGKTWHIEWQAKAIHDHEGNLEFTMLQGFDITSRVQMQEKLRALSVNIEKRVEQERKRIAENLHDSIGELTILTRRTIDDLKQRTAGNPVHSGLHTLNGEIDSFIHTTRELIYNLVPPALYDIGLYDALEELAETFGRKHHVQVTLSRRMDDDPLNEEMRAFVFQAVRECLINAIKHGKADWMHISLDSKDDAFAVAIADNGDGFRNKNIMQTLSSSDSGFGLLNIQNRVSYYLGEMSWGVSDKLGGGKIQIRLPIKSTTRNGKYVYNYSTG